jgi:glutaredoxin
MGISPRRLRLDAQRALLLESLGPLMVKVVLYTKPGCCLCDTVKAQLSEIRRRHPFQLREVNILEDPAARAQFQEEIPVVFVEGRKACQYHLDEKAFIERLKSHPAAAERREDAS